MRIVAFITVPKRIDRILAHLRRPRLRFEPKQTSYWSEITQPRLDNRSHFHRLMDCG